MNTHFDITILIPAKDEALRLPPFLNSVLTFAKNYPGKIEVIVIDDGSRDDTGGVVIKAQQMYPGLKLLRLPTNKGKGYALKCGMSSSQGTIIAFLDADGSTPVEEVSRQIKWFDEGFDIVAGSRVLRDPSSQVQALAYRRWAGALFNSLVHIFLMNDIKDTQCGFKMFRRGVVAELVSRVRLNGYGFDLELLYAAKQLGLRIKETPVNWHHVDGSKVSLLKDSWRMMANIFQIRSWHASAPKQPLMRVRIENLENNYVEKN
ncbi:MAG TPA: dolichyl-phosphate beta-glucosyltransferase [Candidatus Omnitrophota bacterium]|nr:dolichyl-phosphate beta-glucosyltransferase [Candidatus Omnitrophota bacterium]